MPTSLKDVIDAAGGPAVVATVCGVSERAVYKWLTNGRLPRTDYTGETCYAEKLAEAQAHYCKKQILDACRPVAKAA